MIKKIILKDTKTLSDDNLIELNFCEHINLIIGPKGGGKSTLFDLVASLKNGYIPNNVVEALKNADLQFVEAFRFNGERIDANQLSKKESKEKLSEFENRNDVIFQDDPIKKNLHMSNEIENSKFMFIKDLLTKHPEKLSPITNKIREFYDGIYEIIDSNKDNLINWTNTFSIKENNTELNLISALNYNPSDIKNKINFEISTIDYMLENYKKYLSFVKGTKENYSFDKVYLDINFNEKLNKQNELIIEQINSMILLLSNRKKTIKRIYSIIDIFNKSYRKINDEIKKNEFEKQGLKSFEKQAIDYFGNFAKKIVSMKKVFIELLNKEIILSFENQEIEKMFLAFKIDEQIIIDEDTIIELLKIVLHTPKSSKDLAKWILENQKSGKLKKEFKLEKLNNNLSSKLKEKVKVLANGQIYENMSLGQRSIYGIKYKFNKSIDEDIFLDQPEDNLDNNTIATSILELIESKKNNQVFIVTHNANIGILSKPGKVIVADINNPNNLGKPYIEGKLVSDTDKDTESAKYLEGGFKFLEERYKIVKGEK